MPERKVIHSQKAMTTDPSDKIPVPVKVGCPTPDEVEIKFGSDVNPAELTDYSKKILKEILANSCLRSAKVTSIIRTAEEQAQAMYDNLEKGHSAKYHSGGREVIKVYNKEKEDGKSPEQIKQAMINKIHELQKTNTPISYHIDQHPNVLNVFDVGPHSIPTNFHAKFISHVTDAITEGKVHKFLTKPVDPAFHFEIYQPGHKEPER